MRMGIERQTLFGDGTDVASSLNCGSIKKERHTCNSTSTTGSPEVARGFRSQGATGDGRIVAASAPGRTFELSWLSSDLVTPALPLEVRAEYAHSKRGSGYCAQSAYR